MKEKSLKILFDEQQKIRNVEEEDEEFISKWATKAPDPTAKLSKRLSRRLTSKNDAQLIEKQEEEK